MRGWWNARRKRVLLGLIIASFILYWVFDGILLARGELGDPGTAGNVIMLVLLVLIVVPFLGLLWIRRNERRKNKPGG